MGALPAALSSISILFEDDDDDPLGLALFFY